MNKEGLQMILDKMLLAKQLPSLISRTALKIAPKQKQALGRSPCTPPAYHQVAREDQPWRAAAEVISIEKRRLAAREAFPRSGPGGL